MTEKGSTGSGATALIVATFLTGSWLVAWVALILSSEGCKSGPDLWATHVTCLTANEIGDSLAGAFAPLALLWLMVAVFLQSRELRAQRQELMLARQEAVLTRGVLTEQRLEAKRSADLISAQLGILEMESERERQVLADQEMERLFSVLNRSLVRASTDLHLYHNNALVGVFSGHRDRGVDENVLAICNQAIPRLQDLRSGRHTSMKITKGQEVLEEVMNVLAKMEEALEDCSGAQRMRYANADIGRLHDLLKIICDHLGIKYPELGLARLYPTPRKRPKS